MIGDLFKQTDVNPYLNISWTVEGMNKTFQDSCYGKVEDILFEIGESLKKYENHKCKEFFAENERINRVYVLNKLQDRYKAFNVSD